MRVSASALNVRSGPGTQFRVLGKLMRGAIVQISEDYEGWSWIQASPPGLSGWVASRYLEDEKLPGGREAPPHGLTAIKAHFGPPGGPQATAGKVKLPAPLKVSWLDHNITSFACHKKVEKAFETAFRRIFEAGLWPQLKDFGGCYNNRSVKGGGKTSTHAWGIAVDLNTRENPLGGTPKMDSRIVKIFEEEGFVWGGRWGRPDGMHFQYASGY